MSALLEAKEVTKFMPRHSAQALTKYHSAYRKVNLLLSWALRVPGRLHCLTSFPLLIHPQAAVSQIDGVNIKKPDRFRRGGFPQG